MAGDDTDPDYENFLLQVGEGLIDLTEREAAEEEETEEDEETEEEDDEDEEDEVNDESDSTRTTLCGVLYRNLSSGATNSSQERATNVEDFDNLTKGGESGSQDVDKEEDDGGEEGEEWNRSEIDGLFCPIVWKLGLKTVTTKFGTTST